MKSLRKITVGERTVSYILDIGKRKKIYLAVKNGMITVRLPLGVPVSAADDMVAKNLTWIDKALEDEKNRTDLPKRIADGERFSLYGKPFVLKIAVSPEKKQPVIREDEQGGTLTIFVAKAMDEQDHARIFYDFLADLCRAELVKAFEKYEAVLDLHPTKIRISDMSSKWGSCSSSGAVSMNLRLICFERECLEYVVVHELCHLRHMNHSADFWKLVSTCCPDYKRIRERMKH